MTGWTPILVLAAALAWTLWRLSRQARLVRGVTLSLRKGHGFLRDKRHGLNRDRNWSEFIDAANGILEERKRLEADRAGQVERLKATLANMQEAVLTVDDENRILLANEVFHRLFSEDDSATAGIERVFRNPSLLEHLDAVRRGENPGRREIEFARENAPVWTEVSASRIPGFGTEAEEATLLVLHDITRLRRLESVRKEFVANVSHELRTPLSLIKGYVETLTDADAELPEADRRNFLRIIDKHTTRLERLVEDLLALSRLESGNPQLRKERFLVEDLMEEIVENFRSRDDAAGYRFELQLERAPVAVNADALRVAQVIANLLENAIKYSGGEAKIEAGTRHEGDVVQSWVRDSGVGIAEKDLPHIFERFYRVDKGRSRESGGTGLGLSIVKHIVQLHGGSVWATSQPGAGACICFTLPVAEN